LDRKPTTACAEAKTGGGGVPGQRIFIAGTLRNAQCSSMPEWLGFSIFAVFLLLLIAAAVRQAIMEARDLRSRTRVDPGKEYPNNHHVLGVGYYHATDRRWHVSPWNEFREGLGYYWDGDWHETPDIRQVASSVPDADEILRVNEAWRKAGPRVTADFWADVDRHGFGTAIARRQGS
jgi:hypothetical protein